MPKRKDISELSPAYRRRIESGQRRGLTRSQAYGHARKTELPAAQVKLLTTDPHRSVLIRRINNNLDERPLLHHLRQFPLDPIQIDNIISRIDALIGGKNAEQPTIGVAFALFNKARRENYKRATDKMMGPTAMDMLLLLLSDLEQEAEFPQGLSDPTTELLAELAS